MGFSFFGIIKWLFGVGPSDPPNNPVAPVSTFPLLEFVLTDIRELKIDKWETMRNFKKVDQKQKVVQKRKGKKPRRNPEAPPAKWDDENNDKE